MAAFSNWNIPGGTGSNHSSVDLTAPLYSSNDMTVGEIKTYTPADLGLGSLVQKPTDNELKAQQATQQDQWIAENTQRYVDYFNQYANSSIEKQQEVKDNIINNIVPQDIAGNTAFQSNADMATRQLTAVTAALNSLYDARKKAVDESDFYGPEARIALKNASSRFVGTGMGAEQLAADIGQSMSGAHFADGRGRTIDNTPRTERERLTKIIADPKYSAEAKHFAQLQLDKLGSAPQPDETYVQAKDIESTQAKLRLERAKNVAQARKEAQEYVAQVEKENPAVYNESVRQAELKAEDPNYMVGLSNNAYKTRHLANLLIQTAPDIAVIAGASTLGGIPGLVAGTAASYASSYGGIQDQVIQSIMDAPQEQVESNAYYQAMKAQALSNGSSDADADRIARTALGLQASTNHAAEAIVPAVLESFGGPAKILGKAGSSIAGKLVGGSAKKATQATAKAGQSASAIVMSSGTATEKMSMLSKLMTKPSISRTGRFLESAGAEGTSEVLENAAAIHIANQALGTDKSLLDDWLSNFATGALVGAVFGSPALVTGSSKGKAQTATGTTQAQTATGTTQVRSTMGNSLMHNARNTPFYRSLDANAQSQFNQSATTASNIVNQLFGSATGNVDVNALSDSDAVALYNALNTMEQLRGQMGENGRDYVDNFLMRTNMGINARGNKGLLNYDDLASRAKSITASQAQPTQAQPTQAQPTQAQPTQAQPTQAQPTQANGGSNANQGTSQGAGTSTSSATNTQQGTSNAAGQQNTAPASGSSQATQGSGTGGSSHQNSGEAPTNVHTPESENGGTTTGTDSGRDSATDANSGTQSGTGDGSTPSQTEQRSGSDSDTEATGADRATGAVVDRQVRSFIEARNAFDTVRQSYTQRQKAIAEAIRVASGGDATIGDLNSNLFLNMQVMLEAALGQACSRLFSPEIIVASPNSKWYRDSSGKWSTTRPKGKVGKSDALNFATDHAGVAGLFAPNPSLKDTGTVFIVADRMNPSTIMHELAHATVHFLRLHKDELYSQSELGNPYAKQMTDAIDGVAKSLHITADELLDFWGTSKKVKDLGLRNEVAINLEERITKQFEVYLAEHGYNDVHNATLATEEFASARSKFIKAISDITFQLYDTFTSIVINACKTLGIPADINTSAGTLSVFGHAFQLKTRANSRERRLIAWMRSYGYSVADAQAHGVDKNLLPFFDTLTKGLAELSHEHPLNIDNLTAYQTTAMIEATSARLATQYVADGMTMADAFAEAHENVLAMVQEQYAVEQTINACNRMSSSAPNLAASLANNDSMRTAREGTDNQFNRDFGDPAQAVQAALDTNINNSLNIMGYTEDANTTDSSVLNCVETNGTRLANPDTSLDADGITIAPEQLGTIVLNNEQALFQRINEALAGRNEHDEIANQIVSDCIRVANATNLDEQSVINAVAMFHVEYLNNANNGSAREQLNNLVNYNLYSQLGDVFNALHVADRRSTAYNAVAILLSDIQHYHQRVTEGTYAYMQGLRSKNLGTNSNIALSDAMLNAVQINEHSANERVNALSKDKRSFYNALDKSSENDTFLLGILARNSDWFLRGTADAAVANTTQIQLRANPAIRDAINGKGTVSRNELANYINQAQINASNAVNANLRALNVQSRFSQSKVQNVTTNKQGQSNAVLADQIQRSMQHLFTTDAVVVETNDHATAHATILNTIRAVTEQTTGKNNEAWTTFANAVNSYGSAHGITIAELFDANHWTVVETGLPDCPIAFVPDFNTKEAIAGQDDLLQTVTDGVNQIIRKAFHTDGATSENTDVSATAWDELTTQARANKAVTELAEQVGSAEAERLVNRAVALNNMTSEQALESIHSATAGRLNAERTNNETVSDLMADLDATDGLITNAMATDQELVNAYQGILDPDSAYVANMNSSSLEATGLANNGTGVEAQLSDVQEAQARDSFAEDILSEINNGMLNASTDSNATAQSWFNTWFHNNGIADANGKPQGFYANGNRLSTMPSTDPDACEVFTYARASNILEPKAKDHARVSKLIADGNYAEAQIAMNDLGIDAVRMDNGDLWVVNPAEQLSYNYSETMPEPNQDVASVQPSSNAQSVQPAMTAPASVDAQADAIAQMVLAQHERYRQAASARRKETEQSASMNVTMTPPQQAGAWHWIANNFRKQITDWASDFRSWTQLNRGAKVGNAETNPLYMAFVNMKQLVQGARGKIEQSVIAPYTDWCSSIADQLHMDRATVTTELSSARTLLHTIEAAAKQQQELVKAVMDAHAMIDEEYPGAKQEAIADAESNLKAFMDTQNGLTRTNEVTGATEPFVKLYGGKTIAQATTEYQALVDKYGEATVTEAVNRLGQSVDALVSYGIEQGIFSQADVEGFGMWQFYVPLITKTKYEQGVTNDVISLFPSKMNWHRGGSSEPAVDGYTALAYTATRMANNVGSHDFGQEIYRAYNDLATQFNNGEAHVKQAITKIAGVEATYYNGLLVMPAGKLRAIAANEERTYTGELPRQAQQALDSAAASIRVLVSDPANPDAPQHMESMLVWFNDHELQYARTGNGTECTMESHREQQEAIHATFHRPVTQESNVPTPFTGTKLGKFGSWTAKKFPKLTSGMASLCTVYNPGFWGVAYFREGFERSLFQSGKTFRDANGNAVSGIAVSKDYAINLARYSIAASRFALSGKCDPNSKFGQYAQEASELGLFNVGSIKKALANENKESIAILEEYLGTLEQTNDVKTALAKLKSKGPKAIQAVSESVYAPSLMSAYIALRERGVDAKSALYYVTEVNNTNQEGALIKKMHLGAFMPFLRPIAQSAAQILDFYGINTMSFGQGAQSSKQHKRMLKNWAIQGALTTGAAMLIPVLAMALGGGDEDEGYKYLDQLSLDSLNYIPIPLGGGDILKLPLGFGIAPFAFQTAMGISRIIRGKSALPEVAMSISSAFINNLSPIGGPTYETKTVGEFLQKMLLTVTPMPLQGLTQIAVNRDYWGNEITAAYPQAGERASDHYKRRTPEIYRTLAKGMYDWLGIDMYPEQIRALASSYGLGVFRGVVSYIENDPLSKDPMYQSTRDALGPVWTGLGATSMYAKQGNMERRSFYNFEQTCENIIRDAGLYKAMKVKDHDIDPATGVKFKAVDKRMYILRAAGYSEQFVQDYGTMFSTASELKNLETELRKKLDMARKLGGGASTYNALLMEYSTKANVLLKQANSSMSYGKSYQSTDIEAGSEAIKYARMLGE